MKAGWGMVIENKELMPSWNGCQGIIADVLRVMFILVPDKDKWLENNL